VAASGERNRLRALSAAGVENPERAIWQVRHELPGHEFLADDLSRPSEPGDPPLASGLEAL